VGLIKEMHNLVGRGILRAFRRCGLEGGKGVYRYLSQLAGAEGEDLIDKFYEIQEDIGWGKY
jgi:hypothetical protein